MHSNANAKKKLNEYIVFFMFLILTRELNFSLTPFGIAVNIIIRAVANHSPERSLFLSPIPLHKSDVVMRMSIFNATTRNYGLFFYI